MRSLERSAIVLSLLLAAALGSRAPSARAQVIKESTPQIHTNVCSLAESIATSMLGKSVWSKEQAEKTCTVLRPSQMNEKDGAEFLRCCVQKLTSPSATPPAGKAAKPKAEKL
jgi:hypothetical protein